MDFIPSDVILTPSPLPVIHLPLTCAHPVPFTGCWVQGFAVPQESPVLPLLLLEPSLVLTGALQEPQNPPAPQFLK